MESISIPSSISAIGDNAFQGCTGLTNVFIPESIQTIPEYAFEGCTNLKNLIISNSITEIEYNAFSGCISLSIYIPNTVTGIGAYAFTDVPNVYAYPVPYNYIKSKGNNIIIKSEKNLHLIGAPILCVSSPSVTQTTATFNEKNLQELSSTEAPESMDKLSVLKKGMTLINKYYTYDEILSGLVVQNLVPNKEYQIVTTTEYSDGSKVTQANSFKTKGTLPKIVELSKTATAFKCVGNNSITDATFKDEWFTFNGSEYLGNSLSVIGLEPGKKYELTYTVTTEEGSTETAKYSFTTPALELTTLQPKCVSSTCAIVAAATNISEDETGAGFQWKKYDAPESLNPNEGYAAVYGGQLEGYVKNLQSTSYYNVRAFYKSATGKYYYGDWITFDPSDFSYFEPTVHTYSAEDVTESSAKVKGYVLAGTDDITEQGFEYWPLVDSGNNAKSINIMFAASKAGPVETVLATGQVMTAELQNLSPGTTYCLRAFVKTTYNTVYGEEQTFITQGDATGIYNTETDMSSPIIEGYYDLSGHKRDIPQKGINIIRYTDGTTCKIVVK